MAGAPASLRDAEGSRLSRRRYPCAGKASAGLPILALARHLLCLRSRPRRRRRIGGAGNGVMERRRTAPSPKWQGIADPS